jgi:hypothetical protein
MRHTITPEERVAVQIGKLISDLRLDVEKIGTYVARTGGLVVTNRLNVLTEVANEEYKGYDIRANQYTLF